MTAAGLLILVTAPAGAQVDSEEQGLRPPDGIELGQPGRLHDAGVSSQAYGTADVTIHNLQSYSFEPFSGGGNNVAANGFGSRYCTDGDCLVVAPVPLPTGSLLVGLELEGCDDSGAATVSLALFENAPLESGSLPIVGFQTGGPQTPGCGFFFLPADPPHTVDNFNNTYVVSLFMDGIDESVRFQSVRVYYQRQVSPKPGTATFSDVSTSHPFHQFVEAMADSAVTSGCTASKFCPDAPLTRGQMAVFLSKALGLHWPDE